MTPEGLIVTLLQMLTGGGGVSLAPSLFSLKLDFTNASLLKIGNVTINVGGSSDESVPEEPLPLSVVRKDGQETELLQIGSVDKDRSESPGPFRCHLEPHLIFDRRTIPGEFEVAPYVKVVVAKHNDLVTITRVNAYAQMIYLDAQAKGKPVALEVSGDRIPFDKNGTCEWVDLPWPARWTMSELPLDIEHRIGQLRPTTQRGPVLVSVGSRPYKAVWHIVREDLRGREYIPEHFLLLVPNPTKD